MFYRTFVFANKKKTDWRFIDWFYSSIFKMVIKIFAGMSGYFLQDNYYLQILGLTFGVLVRSIISLKVSLYKQLQTLAQNVMIYVTFAESF